MFLFFRVRLEVASSWDSLFRVQVPFLFVWSCLGVDSSFFGSACPLYCWRRSLRAEMNRFGSWVSSRVGLAGGWFFPMLLISSLWMNLLVGRSV